LPDDPPDQLRSDPSEWPGAGSDDFDPKSHIWDGREWWTSDRQFWWDGFQWQSRDVPHTPRAPARWEPEAELSPQGRRRRRDFWLGFIGWFAVNGAVLIVIARLEIGAQQIGSGVLLVANLTALTVLAFLRGYVALGMVTAFGVIFGAVVAGGVFFTAGDYAGFAAGGGGLGGAVVVWIIGAIVIVAGAGFALRGIHRSIR